MNIDIGMNKIDRWLDGEISNKWVVIICISIAIIIDWRLGVGLFLITLILSYGRGQKVQSAQQVQSQPSYVLLENSVAFATDFFFRALHNQLEKEYATLVDIPTEIRTRFMCGYIGFKPPKTCDDGEQHRSVYFDTVDAHGSAPFRVELRKCHDEEWRVVGFEYPTTKLYTHQEERWYAVFEPHDWFGWKKESYEVVDSY